MRWKRFFSHPFASCKGLARERNSTLTGSILVSPNTSLKAVQNPRVSVVPGEQRAKAETQDILQKATL